ncbi:MAG: serine protease [Bacteroidota bacterium]
MDDLVSGFSKKFKWRGGRTINPKTNTPYEAIIGQENFAEIWWLEEALKAAKKVAKIKKSSGSATGFMISEDLLMTNHHVFGEAEDTVSATIQFNFKSNKDGSANKPDEWVCDAKNLFKSDKSLDYAIVRLKPKSGKRAGKKWGYFNLSHETQLTNDQRLNIIQHPAGRHQQIVFRDNQLKAIESNLIQYLTDTDYGSSGSPVLDDDFNVIAIHSRRVEDPKAKGSWYRNQGYRISKIYKKVKKYLDY